MARTTTPTSKRKPGVSRGAKPAATKAPRASIAKKTAPARKAAAPAKSKTAPARAGRPAATRPPVQSKQELRDRIEKLERANVVLRAKNREAIEASREAANRIDQLEEQIGRQVSRESTPTPVEETLTKEAGTKDSGAEAAPAKPAARRGRKPKPALVPEEPTADEAHDDEM